MRRQVFRLLAISTLVVLTLAIMVVTTRGAARSVESPPQAAADTTGALFPWRIFRAEMRSARAGADTYEYTIRNGGTSNTVLSVREVMQGWATKEEFRRFYVAQLKAAPFEAAFWETPPMLTTTIDRPFRYVLVDSPKPYGLAAVREERSAFEEHFSRSTDIAAFYNLGGSSRLIAPVPKDTSRNYAHFLAFLRSAPEEQACAMFKVIAQEFNNALDERKAVWLSTAGMGVFYTHVRLDPRPKYYRYGPYKSLQGDSS